MCQFGAHDVSFRPTNLGASKIGSPWLGCLTVSRGQEFEIGPVALRQRLDRGQSCAYYPQESREKAPLSLDKFAFARLQDAPEGGDQSQLLDDPLMRFVGALDAILALAVTWKPLGHFENTTWHKPTNCRVDDNDISNLEFV